MAGAATDSTLRTFVAVDLPEAVKEALAEEQTLVQSYLARQGVHDTLRWTPASNLHLTLRFLGDTTPRRRIQVSEGLAAASAHWPAFDLSVGGLGCFPSFRNPRVVWFGLHGTLETLDLVQREVERIVQQAGFAADDRPFSPHLTVARARREAPRRSLQQTGLALEAYVAAAGSNPGEAVVAGPFAVDYLVYYESELRRSGSVYTPLATIRFGHA